MLLMIKPESCIYTHSGTRLHTVSTAVRMCLAHADLEASKNGIGESYSDFILTFGENSVAISTAHKGLHKFFFLPQVSQGFFFLYMFFFHPGSHGRSGIWLLP